jgi:hypothetical protein
VLTTIIVAIPQERIDMDTPTSQLFPAATALAGLILVFLGGVFTAYERYDTEQKAAVRSKYRLRAWLAFSGFLLALFAATTPWIVRIGGSEGWLTLGTVALALAFAVLIAVAFLAMMEMN